MLDNERYNRAILANENYTKSDLRQLFLEEEFKTQNSLRDLGIQKETTPSQVPHTGTILMAPELIPDLRIPYAVEVLGMPRAGKTSLINRYLIDLWQRKERHKVTLVNEGARSIKEEYGDLRYSDPFSYSMLGGTASFVGYIEKLQNVNQGMRVMISDRGQIDRSVFRRTLFSQGHVDPKLMANEDEFRHGLENTPVQMGGVILLMTRPETSLIRSKKVGPVANMEFLPLLYEQYWRLHNEILKGRVPYRIYTCIDGEKDQEGVYERFKYAMDTALNIHTIFFEALAKAFPQEFDKAQKELSKNTPKQSRAEQILAKKLGVKKVLIVGGDEMASKDDILMKNLVEGKWLK